VVEEQGLEMIEVRGERFKGFNIPKRTPKHPTKSHAVLAKVGDQVRLIRFGQQGVKGSPKKKNESEAYRNRRLSFKRRHKRNIDRGPLFPAFWADKVKWFDSINEADTVEKINDIILAMKEVLYTIKGTE